MTPLNRLFKPYHQQPKYNPEAHKERSWGIKGLFLVIALTAALVAFLAGCTPKHGCPAIRKHHLQGYGWMYSPETKVLAVWNKEGRLLFICKNKTII